MPEHIKQHSEDLHTGQTIRTFNGHYVNVFNPDPATIDIEDIAHGLSQVCRFAGHTYQFYSVAQHSVMVADLVPHGMRLEALLHDASEAYMCDMPRPIKRNMPQYKEIEEVLMAAIAKKFKIKYPFHKEIKEADNHMLEVEHKHIIIDRNQEMFRIWSIEKSKMYFLARFKTLYGQ